MKVLPSILLLAKLAGAASTVALLWPQAAPPPPGTTATGEQRPITLAPGITIPAGGPGIVPVPRPQSPPQQTQGGAPPTSSATPGVSAPPVSRPGSIITSGPPASAALDPTPATRAPGGCSATLSTSRVAVRSAGDVVEVRTQPVPAGCTPAVAVRTDWMQRITSDNPALIRFSVGANPSREPRLTSIEVADKVFLVEQAGVEAPAVSVVPGKLAFGLDPKKTPPKRRITVQADDTNTTVAVMGTARWVTVTPVKGKGREYDVQVDTGAIPPGRLREAAIRVSAGTAVVDVPVVVERQETR